MKKSRKYNSQEIVFDISQLSSDLGLTAEQTIDYIKNTYGIDVEYASLHDEYRAYLHYTDQAGLDFSELFSLFSYVTAFRNNKKGEDYTDLYIQVQEMPDDRIFIKKNDDTIWLNIKYSEIVDGTYNLNELTLERDLWD